MLHRHRAEHHGHGQYPAKGLAVPAIRNQPHETPAAKKVHRCLPGFPRGGVPQECGRTTPDVAGLPLNPQQPLLAAVNRARQPEDHGSTKQARAKVHASCITFSSIANSKEENFHVFPSFSSACAISSIRSISHGIRVQDREEDGVAAGVAD